jgi:hypothetical protein
VAPAIPHFSQLLADAPHGQLFFSGGDGTDGVLVTDLDDGSTVCAALPDRHASAATSTGRPGTR